MHAVATSAADHPIATRNTGVSRPPLDWRTIYAWRLAFSDLAVIGSAVAVAHVAAFRYHFLSAEPAPVLPAGARALSGAVIVAWFLALTLGDTRKYRIIGAGSTEYRLVFDSTIRLLGVLALIALFFHVPLARGYLATAFPLGLIGLITTRAVWRRWLGHHRAQGRYSSRVYLVGSEGSVLHLAGEFARHPAAGYRVVGACVPRGVNTAEGLAMTVPVTTDLDTVIESMDAVRADTLIVASGDDLSPNRVRRLSWALEQGQRHLIVAPSLTDVAGPRLHTRPVSGFPLIHVETPHYSGGMQVTKRAFDLLGSVLLLIGASPVLLAVALAVRLTSHGPALFFQHRVGLNGRPFRMVKFRSMVADAEQRRHALLDSGGDAGNAVLFKLRDDPRITRVGQFIRRYSLDELPQLFNVVTGSMSLVGPRPPLEREVAEYDPHVHRRFLVKPGMTGLWQVSGRSDLSWDASVRLDLYYVENWSIAGDLVILWRTARAALRGSGAY